jgi:hypothetical protein
VEKHGEKFEEYVILRCGTSAKPRVPTVVRISVSGFPVVRMSCGWKKFAAYNGLREGDSLVFCLRALSEFEVYVFPGNGHPISSPISVTTPVDALCEPMGRIMTFGEEGRTASGSQYYCTSQCNASHSTRRPSFIMVSFHRVIELSLLGERPDLSQRFSISRKSRSAVSRTLNVVASHKIIVKYDIRIVWGCKENARVSALRTSRFPPVGHGQERSESAGDGNVGIGITGNNDHSSQTFAPIPSMRFLFA